MELQIWIFRWIGIGIEISGIGIGIGIAIIGCSENYCKTCVSMSHSAKPQILKSVNLDYNEDIRFNWYHTYIRVGVDFRVSTLTPTQEVSTPTPAN